LNFQKGNAALSALPFCDAPTVFIEGFRKFCYNEKSAEGTSYGVLKMRWRE